MFDLSEAYQHTLSPGPTDWQKTDSQQLRVMESASHALLLLML